MTSPPNRTHGRNATCAASDPLDGPDPADRRRAVLLATGLATVVAFELALAAGAPWGSAAYGGGDPGRLSTELRIGSVFVAGFWLLAALTALARGGVAASPIPYASSRRAVWGLTVLLAAGAAMNAASSSSWERFGWAPFIVGLTVLSWRLARSHHPDRR
jgi:hypothetical protein